MNPRPEINPTLAKPKVGESILLTCIAVGQLTVISWSKDGRKMLADNKNVFINASFEPRIRSVKSTFEIKQVNSSDTGKYRCTISTRLDRSFTSYTEAKVSVQRMLPISLFV